MQVISDTKELEKHTYIKTRNPNIFPKKERLGLAQRMMNEASDLVADLMEANDLLLTDRTATPTTYGRTWTPISSHTSRS